MVSRPAQKEAGSRLSKSTRADCRHYPEPIFYYVPGSKKELRRQ
ncbi:MAG: hypothetical protein PARBA_02051 [Parabacteroides sp.]